MKADVYLAQKLINALRKYQLMRDPQLNDPDASWKNLFANGQQKVLFNLTDKTEINLYLDSILSKLIFEGFEKNEMSFLKKFLKKGDIFFDIGANMGLHTLIAAEALDSCGHIYTFEPTPNTYKRLNENIGLNHLEDLVSTFPIGLSDKDELLKLNISNDGHDAWNSFADLTHVTFEDQHLVTVTRLDSFILNKQLPLSKIALIKIDVEGWEMKVLNGIEPFFSKPDFNATFLIEFTEENTFRAGYSCRELYQYMLDFDFEWFSFETGVLEPAELKAYYPYENLIAVKRNNFNPVKERLKIT